MERRCWSKGSKGNSPDSNRRSNSSSRRSARTSADNLIRHLREQRGMLAAKNKSLTQELDTTRLVQSDTGFAGVLTTAAREAVEVLVARYRLAPSTKTLGAALGYAPVRTDLKSQNLELLRALGHIGGGTDAFRHLFKVSIAEALRQLRELGPYISNDSGG